MRFTSRSRVAVATVALVLAAVPGLALAHQKHHGAAAKATAPTQKVSIDFAAVAGSKPVACGKPITGLGRNSTTAQLTDLRFYVSDVRLLRRGGGSVALTPPANSQWSYSKGDAAVTLIDLENGASGCAAEGNKAMNAAVTGSVPKGSYTGVSFSVSVPDSLNHTDLTTMPAPLNNTAMGWSWQFGRKFMKIEVSEDGGPAWAEKTFFVHIGSTGCTGNPAAGKGAHCSLPNADEVTLSRFDPARQKIAVDLRALLAGVAVEGNTGSAMPMVEMEGMDEMGGCMSASTSPDCKPIFESLGMKLGTNKKTAQTTFRVVGR